MPKRIQVLVELNVETGRVRTTAPSEHADVVLQMLGQATAQVARGVQPKPKDEPMIVVPKAALPRG